MDDIRKVLDFLPKNSNMRIFELWEEYNKCQTKEAKLVKALDKIETIIQHNQGQNPSDFDYKFNLNYGKKYCEDDEIIKFMRNIVDKDTKNNC